jgi:hypothetical protein
MQRAAFGILLGVACVAARAADWDLSVDARAVSSDALPPFSQGGTGAVRYGQDESGLRLGRARFALTQQVGELWSVHVDASVYDNQAPNPLAVTEAYVLFRPYPFYGWRLRVKAGGFYAPVSLENRAAGWDSPYTVSFSAIDSWLAAEVRTIGVEGTLDWLGTRSGHGFDLGLTGGIFGWNDQAGDVLASSGFMLTDRQTGLFQRVGQPGGPVLYLEQPFLAIDHRAGLYGGLEARWLDRVVVRVLRYDNRADPTVVDTVSEAVAWNTHFDSAGVRIEGEHGWTVIAQWLGGETSIAPQGEASSWPFGAEYALLAKRFGRHTLAARYDRFWVEANGYANGDGWQNGHAWTWAYSFEPDAHWRFALEWVQAVSSSYNHTELGYPQMLTENQLQLQVRYSIGSARPYR